MAEQTSTIVKCEIFYVPDDKIADVWPKAIVGDVSGYLPVEDMELIDTPGLQRVTQRPNGHPRVLESIYLSYQRVDGDVKSERVEQLKKRSMSVGDAVRIDEEVFWVAPEGFVQKVDDEIVPVEASDA
jgi:hypothetical protein